VNAAAALLAMVQTAWVTTAAELRELPVGRVTVLDSRA